MDIDFDLYSGVVLINGKNKDTGGSNGSGKSLIQEALSWGLFGKTIRKSTEEAMVNNQEKKGTSVTIYLDDYVVCRTRKPTSLNLSRSEVNLTRSSVPDTQAEIVKLLGVSHKTFLASVIFGQHNDFDFISATPDDKRLIMKDFLNLEEIFALRGKIKANKSDLNTQLKASKAVIDELETAIESAEALSKVNIEDETLAYERQCEIRESYEKVLDKKIAKEIDIERLQDKVKDINYKLDLGVFSREENCKTCGQPTTVTQTDKDISQLQAQKHLLTGIYTDMQDDLAALEEKWESLSFEFDPDVFGAGPPRS